ncbi:extracellular catalytic domain type 1 short-chain-length polyhydroxyalkanoate depolymerase [Shewanella sp. HL-SH4]|uniref:extracellular catalytic domain type 1 short-chain-length polyhydroxyalkanoate depolymerase n=1 Tax=Shewanella sp. HL-SH4 TaxID=3436240 RepID=UPI003EC09087
MRNKFHGVISSVFVLCWIVMIQPVQATDTPYIPLTDFGDNPGALTSFYLPLNEALNTDDSSLVVLLHGCIQDGVELANKTGLTALALENNFAVLVPQQSYDNNVKRCFNWFASEDTQLDSGEMLSIKNMILAAQERLGAKHVYVIGLSAGGAMTSAALVNYPNLFKGGAVIAGLPYPCADNLIKAISCMKRGPAQTAEELAQFAQAIHPQQTHWPALTIWAGDSDIVVDANNAHMLASQWLLLTQSSTKAQVKNESGYSISRWKDTQDNAVIELVIIKNMGHGIAVNPDINHGGEETDFLIKTPISSVVEIIKLWGL